jgi:hypothetical protein
LCFCIPVEWQENRRTPTLFYLGLWDDCESNSYYLRYCTEHGLPQHPARFPAALPEYFIRMLTDVGDIVFDPFAGSCVTGEVAERLKRRWICCELVEDYLKGALGRFEASESLFPEGTKSKEIHYKLAHPATMWNGMDDEPLQADGGKTRKKADAVVYPTKEEPELVGAVRESSKKLQHSRAAQNAKKRNHTKTGS